MGRSERLSAMPVLSEKMGCAFQHNLYLLRVLKQLKYLWNLSESHLAIWLEQLSKVMPLCPQQPSSPWRDRYGKPVTPS